MMEIGIYQVDAFASRPFTGNPAAVCPLGRWLPDEVLQSVAAENNLSETAFFVKRSGGYELRWFTPTVEVDLCGHATLASAFVIHAVLGASEGEISFDTKSGTLRVEPRNGLYALTMPANPGKKVVELDMIARGLGCRPAELYEATDYMAVFETEEQIRALQPDMGLLSVLETRGVIATAPGGANSDCDFVSRFFAPGAGIQEDPVTGSSHCTLLPYWSKRLGKPELKARQVSARGGELECSYLGEKVRVAGSAVLYLKGTIIVPG